MKRDISPLLWKVAGLALVAGAVWMAWDRAQMFRWPSVEAESLGAAVVDRQSTGRRVRAVYHDVSVTFRFEAAGRQVIASGVAESHSMRGHAEHWASKRYARGTRHRIRFDPADPTRIAAEEPDMLADAVTVVPVLLIGALFLWMGFGDRRGRRPST
jgi:hypothetical protein